MANPPWFVQRAAARESAADSSFRRIGLPQTTRESAVLQTVSANPAETPLDPQSLPALAEARRLIDNFDQFFGEVFDELHTLAAELWARHRCLSQDASAGARLPISEVRSTESETSPKGAVGPNDRRFSGEHW